jgi:hypothetical protein
MLDLLASGFAEHASRTVGVWGSDGTMAFEEELDSYRTVTVRS